MSTVNTITEQLTRAGQAIEHDSFAIIDQEVGPHGYTPQQWPIVRRMIHANADFDFNGLTRFHPDAVRAGLQAMLRGGTPIVADVEMICVGLSKPRLAHFGMMTHQFISDADVIAQARADGVPDAMALTWLSGSTYGRTLPQVVPVAIALALVAGWVLSEWVNVKMIWRMKRES